MRTCNYISAAVASPPPLRQWPGGISWRRSSRLQCSATPTRHGDLDKKGDNRLRQTTGIFQPSIWGDVFLDYSNPAAASSQQQIQMQERVDKLREEVAKMIVSSTTTSSRLHLIDALERLCLDHLFEQEISATLAQIETADVTDWDLGTVALWFCLLRKHRYTVSPDVFVRFKDKEGGFLVDSPKDLLNLYNAAHMRTHGDIILNEAILYSQRRLDTMIPYMEGSLAREIKSALEIPLPRRVRIYEFKYYISAYEKDATVHEKVLQLAKLNSNIMQLHHQHELDIISSWDSMEAHDLPECMKFGLEKIFDSYGTIENMLHQEEKYRMPYLRQSIKDLVRSYNMEVKMLQAGYIPKSTEEHLKLSMITVGYPILSCASFVGMHDIATKDCFDWVSSVPKMVEALSVILRLVDDLVSYEREQLIPHVASTIDSYMKEHNVSIEIARGQIHVLKEESWKDFNSEWLNRDNNAYGRQVLERLFNLARTAEFMYNKEENFTKCHNLKDTIHSLLLAEPFKVPI
ncbi:zingiberene synthase-like isoform X2 [Sorghum bicolor]|uniref:zingiberene synthase-like isoform X2 n=1 Tax=Sorghum bicolor TaxID=4558 RepID=UPI000B424D73|nr:zingiberene synthase-like isoform X2 [Sorghum bicolor]|eukprot:XP_021302854.1 zingiberene synthase-like isoform X2 [Sorghum bicolor]